MALIKSLLCCLVVVLAGAVPAPVPAQDAGANRTYSYPLRPQATLANTGGYTAPGLANLGPDSHATSGSWARAGSAGGMGGFTIATMPQANATVPGRASPSDDVNAVCDESCSQEVCTMLRELRQGRLQTQLDRNTRSMTLQADLQKGALMCLERLLDINLLGFIFNLPDPVAIINGIIKSMLLGVCMEAIRVRRDITNMVTAPLDKTFRTPSMTVLGQTLPSKTILGTRRTGDPSLTINHPGGGRTVLTPAEVRDELYGGDD